MTATQIILLVLTIISGVSYLVARYYGNIKLIYIFKPLTTFLILLTVFLHEPGSESYYKNLIVAGISFALAGDIMLMLPNDRFKAGLSAFATAVILFTIASAEYPGPYFGWGYLIPAFIYAMVFLAVFLKRTRKMRVPVIVYVIVLTLFLWQVSGRAWYLADNDSIMTFFGAVLFIISDTMLAYSRYIKRLKLAPVLYMSFYWIALLLFAYSI